MTNKEKYIKAMEETIAKHENPEGNKFVAFSQCKLCEINLKYIHNIFEDNCGHCIYNNGEPPTNPKVGCSIIFNVYKDSLTDDHYPTIDVAKYRIKSVIPILKKHLEYIKTRPEKQFTKKGWKPFNLHEIK